jgi:hypothetical protein
MKPTFKQLFRLFLLIFITNVSAQEINFDNYRTIKAKGDVPDVFQTNLGEKYQKAIKTEYKELNASEKAVFVNASVINIHDMLMAGDVIFGDTITNYVNSIADKICGDDSELRNKLSFYTTKSSYTNALSTDHGIIFISTGLIGQLTNEAQLAFVLAHEIAHFEKGHSMEKYEEYLNQRRTGGAQSKILEFSREKENEADERGAELYSKAGYKMSELNGTMDVLMYSYMPFDETPVAKDYFNNTYVAFGLDRWGEVGAISAVDDFDDDQSTHPNISERRKNIDSISKAVGGDGTTIYLNSEAQFNYIRTICRFEMLRSYIASEEFINAMYAAFLLEKEFPTSYYIKRCKARIWYGIASYDFSDGKEKGYQDDDWEGEVSLMNNFVQSMTGIEKVVYAARLIEDVRLLYPESKEMMLMSERSARLLAKTEDFKVEDFSKEPATLINFKEMEDMVTNWYDKKYNKYEKIARKRGMVRKEDPSEKVRPDHEFWIPDLINSSSFMDLYTVEKESVKKQEEEDEAIKKLKSKKRQLKENEVLIAKMKASDNKLLIVQPQISSMTVDLFQEKPNLDKYNALEINLLSTIKSVCQSNRISTYNIGIKEIKNQGCPQYNELMTLYNIMNQSYEGNEDYIPIDFEDIEEIKETYDVNKLVLPIMYHTKTKLGSSKTAGLLMIAPVLPMYLVSAIGMRHITTTTMAVFDLSSYNFSGYYRSTTYAKPSKYVVGSQIHNFLTTIKK